MVSIPLPGKNEKEIIWEYLNSMNTIFVIKILLGVYLMILLAINIVAYRIICLQMQQE